MRRPLLGLGGEWTGSFFYFTGSTMMCGLLLLKPSCSQLKGRGAERWRETRPWCYHWIVPWIKLYLKLFLSGLLLHELIMSLFPYPLARATGSCHLTARGRWTLAITYEAFLCASHHSNRCSFIISFISHRSSVMVLLPSPG